jgi:putative oxidoreductase
METAARSRAIAIAGRVLFTLIFFLSGITHFTQMGDYVALMPAFMPWKPFWVVVSALVELVGAALIVSNRGARLGAWLIVAFLVPVTALVHGVALATAADPKMQAIQASFFLKGLAMLGCALLMTQLGVSPARR